MNFLNLWIGLRWKSYFLWYDIINCSRIIWLYFKMLSKVYKNWKKHKKYFYTKILYWLTTSNEQISLVVWLCKTVYFSWAAKKRQSIKLLRTKTVVLKNNLYNTLIAYIYTKANIILVNTFTTLTLKNIEPKYNLRQSF